MRLPPDWATLPKLLPPNERRRRWHRRLTWKCRSVRRSIACSTRTCRRGARSRRCSRASPARNFSEQGFGAAARGFRKRDASRRPCIRIAQAGTESGVDLSIGLAGAGKSSLAPRLVDGDRDRVGNVEAAHRRLHRNAHPDILREVGEDRLWQPCRFAAEYKHVVIAKLAREKRSLTPGRQRIAPACAERGEARRPVGMDGQPRVFVVVETGAFKLAIGQVEAERLDEVQFGAGIRGEADDITGVGRDFRLHQYDRYHRRASPRTLTQKDRAAGAHQSAGGSVRATTQFSTLAAPEALRIFAASARDAPVVITSSTSATVRPERSRSHAKAPRTFFARSAHGSPACGGVARTRESPRGSSGTPLRAPITRPISSAWL